ncbi:ImmA/IrrE family metallo-endopeptidase [Caldimonas sp.]|uniref:ImmA/IrrE family metallo-endopeptidase n=1 Tax=Caldimonas sp. TaxID=2838790 RepID=UPI00391BE117
MSAAPQTPSATAARIWKVLRGVFGASLPAAINLEVVRDLLNQPAFGKGAVLKAPLPIDAANFEGMLANNPNAPNEWGIFYRPRPKCPERERFTIAHEMGHFLLHRERQSQFQCDKSGVTSGQADGRNIEREANAFASQLLMPRDDLDKLLGDQGKVDLHILSEIAREFHVSFEALCLRFVEITKQRAVLIRWDNGYLDYERRSRSALRTKAGYRKVNEMQEPAVNSLAADTSVTQCFEGEVQSAALWCPNEAPHMKLREFKHTYADRDRVITLLLLESAEPRSWDRSWHDEENFDCADQFASNGQPTTSDR